MYYVCSVKVQHCLFNGFIITVHQDIYTHTNVTDWLACSHCLCDWFTCNLSVNITSVQRVGNGNKRFPTRFLSMFLFRCPPWHCHYLQWLVLLFGVASWRQDCFFRLIFVIALFGTAWWFGNVSSYEYRRVVSIMHKSSLIFYWHPVPAVIQPNVLFFLLKRGQRVIYVSVTCIGS